MTFVPIFSLRFDVKFHFVSYKWPSWLTEKQTEKQRLIWAYKVLFLDVLFPMSVPKIIYIDADQVRFFKDKLSNIGVNGNFLYC